MDQKQYALNRELAQILKGGVIMDVTFAKNLGISNITVENAYAQLQAEGFIYSIPKKGFYITGLPENMPVNRREHINHEAGWI